MICFDAAIAGIPELVAQPGTPIIQRRFPGGKSLRLLPDCDTKARFGESIGLFAPWGGLWAMECTQAPCGPQTNGAKAQKGLEGSVKSSPSGFIEGTDLFDNEVELRARRNGSLGLPTRTWCVAS